MSPQHTTRHPAIPQDAYELHFGDSLAEYYNLGLFTLTDLKTLYSRGKIIFWHLFDIYSGIGEVELATKKWIEEIIPFLTTSTDECILLLRDFSLSETDIAIIQAKAQTFTKDTQDFLELDDMNLFREEDMPKFIKSASSFTDRIDIYNFLHSKPQYTDLFHAYKKEFTSHIQSLEDFKDIYMYSYDPDLREKAKKAIEQLTGINIS